jgi:peptidoglycan/LPS O-acetylase OafA/YrhL
MPGLDVLRGVAVGLVLLRHSWPDMFPGAGIVGVTIFFALSGYLITGLLANELAHDDRLRVGNFYLRRVVRLYPALLTLLFVWLIVEVNTNRMADRGLIPSTLFAGLLYLADIPIVRLSNGMTHLWSLAVEEQFYLIWPAALWLAWRRAALSWLLAGSICGSWVATCVLLLVGRPGHLYALPTSWAVALLAGATLRLYGNRRMRAKGRFWMSLLPACALAAACFLPGAKDRAVTYVVVIPAVGLGSAILAKRMSCWPRRWITEPFRTLGLISYGAYLWNYPITHWFMGSAQGMTWWESWLSPVLSIAVASVSFLAVERPISRLFRRHTSRRAVKTGVNPDPVVITR